jgi:hypothetical protein
MPGPLRVSLFSLVKLHSIHNNKQQSATESNRRPDSKAAERARSGFSRLPRLLQQSSHLASSSPFGRQALFHFPRAASRIDIAQGDR